MGGYICQPLAIGTLCLVEEWLVQPHVVSREAHKGQVFLGKPALGGALPLLLQGLPAIMALPGIIPAARVRGLCLVSVLGVLLARSVHSWHLGQELLGRGGGLHGLVLVEAPLSFLILVLVLPDGLQGTRGLPAPHLWVQR
jgi:hypothetical protein